MSNRRSGFRSVSDVCAHLKHLGYSISRRIRLYGEEFKVVSDPDTRDNVVVGNQFDTSRECGGIESQGLIKRLREE
jgi:hypothetical protein